MQPSDRPKGGAITREFSVGQTVTARNYTSSTKWVSGIIQTQLGPLSYEAAVKTWLSKKIDKDNLLPQTLKSRLLIPDYNSSDNGDKDVVNKKCVDSKTLL